MTNSPLDIPGMKHELLHMAYVMSDMFDRHVAELAERLRAESAISSDMLSRIDEISDALASLYQSAGNEG